MGPVLTYFAGLVQLTLTDPLTAGRRILDGGIPREALWTLFLLVMVLSAIMSELSLILIPVDPENQLFEISPLMVGAMVGGSILITSAAITWVGKAFGGTGEMGNVLILMIWLQVMMIAAQVVQIAFGVLIPGLAGLITLASLGLLLWLLTNFIAVAHGFRNRGQVFLMTILSMFAIAFCLSILLAILGLMVPS